MPVASAVDVSPLFTPLQLKHLRLPNRFFMPSMQRAWGVDEQVSDKMIDYYVDRVRGGTALLMTEGVVIDHPAARMGVGELQLTPRTRDSWARCADRVKEAGGTFFMQFWHPGASRAQDFDPTVAPLSPSGQLLGKPHGRAATEQDLDDLAAAWATAATTAQELGFDGVEVHMAHGYLLHQFLWSGMNVRDDDHGGDDIADRARFPARVLRTVRQAVGPDFVVSVRLSQWAEADFEAKVARSPEELQALIGILEAEGPDLFNVSTRNFNKPEWPEVDRRGLAGWVSSMTELPVMAVGSVGLDLDLMQTLFTQRPERHTLESSLRDLVPRFERGEFDMIGVGRSIIGDPEFVNKVRDGRLQDIRPFTRADLADALAGIEGHELPLDAELIEDAAKVA